MAGTVISVSEAVRTMMKQLGYVGSFDVRLDESRHTGWVGKPGGGEEFAVTVTIEPILPRESKNPSAE